MLKRNNDMNNNVVMKSVVNVAYGARAGLHCYTIY